ncbi:MAG: hypothetical protein RMZ43_023850 [Nostoc sp. CmiVER01]|uniref:hypothetical protein n=1 Tax=Nostoc sp. CmiVER01 TaxID=3075384 RepID=UPI002AD304E7|nr:hypothetical protein [Nostoc sp. CmiVER01]MDZ8122392.1 hypothetical protein [Nostoc sp. CmiVER01]
MAIFRQYIAPLLAVLVFLFALVAVSARIFLPSDMAAPAPIEQVGVSYQATPTDFPPAAYNVN